MSIESCAEALMCSTKLHPIYKEWKRVTDSEESAKVFRTKKGQDLARVGFAMLVTGVILQFATVEGRKLYVAPNGMGFDYQGGKDIVQPLYLAKFAQGLTSEAVDDIQAAISMIGEGLPYTEVTEKMTEWLIKRWNASTGDNSANPVQITRLTADKRPLITPFIERFVDDLPDSLREIGKLSDEFTEARDAERRERDAKALALLTAEREKKDQEQLLAVQKLARERADALENPNFGAW